MTDKKKACQQAGPSYATHPNNTSSSSSAQRTRLLARLLHGPLDTITARRELSILMPAARIKELRDDGHDIRRHLVSLTDEQGCSHHGIALYYLPQTGE